MSGAGGLPVDLPIAACAVSAGVHAALVPGHLDDGTAAGAGFALAAVALAVAAAGLTTRPAGAGPRAAAALLLAALLALWGLAVTGAVPLLHPEPEPVDGLGLATKAVEALGLWAALRPAPRCRPMPLPLTILIGLFGALLALSLAGGHGAHAA